MGSHRFEVITKNNLSSLGFLRSRNGFFRLCPAFARVSFDYHVCRLQSHDCIKVVAGSGVRQWFSLRRKTFQVDAMDEINARRNVDIMLSIWSTRSNAET